MKKDKYVLRFRDGQFFVQQNLYLSCAILGDLNEADKMSLDEAEGALNRMTDRGRWQIFEVTTGWVLGQENTRQIYLAKKKQLEKELAEIDNLLKGC